MFRTLAPVLSRIAPINHGWRGAATARYILGTAGRHRRGPHRGVKAGFGGHTRPPATRERGMASPGTAVRKAGLARLAPEISNGKRVDPCKRTTAPSQWPAKRATAARS